MAGAVRTEAYAILLSTLVAARNASALSQAALANRLGKPPSYVAKYELGERRLDLVETLVVMRELDMDPASVLAQVSAFLPARL